MNCYVKEKKIFFDTEIGYKYIITSFDIAIDSFSPLFELEEFKKKRE